MPQALLLIAPVTFGVGGSLALFSSVGVLSGLGIAASIGGSVLLSGVAGAISNRNRPPSAVPENVELNIRQAIGARMRHFGTVQVGGTVTFFRTRSGKFYRVLAHGDGEIEDIIAYKLDQKLVELDGAGFVLDGQYISKGEKRVQILTRRGEATSTNYDEIEAIWAAYDADHRLDGIWSSLTIADCGPADEFRAMYPNGEPSLALLARGAKLRNPHTGVVAWSDNMGLAIGNLIEHPDGFNLSGMVDDAYLGQAASDSADAISLAAGGVEARWRIGGSYALTETPGSVLRSMLDACAGDVMLLPNGKIAPFVGKWREPDVTLDRSELISIESWTSGPDRLDRYTELPFTYVDPLLDFTVTTGDTWIDPTREAVNGEIAVGPQLDLSFAPSHGQGRRAAKERIERDNPLHELVTVWKPSARRAMFERFITITMAELPSVYWRVKSYSLRLADGSLVLSLASYDPACLGWSPAEEGAPQALPEPDVPQAIPEPADLTVIGAGIQTSQNTYTAGIAVACDAAPTDSLSMHVEYATINEESGAIGKWQAWPIAAGEFSTVIVPLIDGREYAVRVWFETHDGNPSVKTQVTAIARATTTEPAAPTGLAVDDEAGGNARVQLTTSTSPDLWKTEVYRDGGLIATLFENAAQTVVIFDSPGAGTFNWTARSINVSNTPNETDAGPVSQIIT